MAEELNKGSVVENQPVENAGGDAPKTYTEEEVQTLL
jgi:hypothetical protein